MLRIHCIIALVLAARSMLFHAVVPAVNLISTEHIPCSTFMMSSNEGMHFSVYFVTEDASRAGTVMCHEYFL